ncbi:hypothetical protein chiPu_0022809, partial [Chiloscyllium punctatum]|nr:hypothetical protein [Chiloscyllium punctatum]
MTVLALASWASAWAWAWAWACPGTVTGPRDFPAWSPGPGRTVSVTPGPVTPVDPRAWPRPGFGVSRETRVTLGQAGTGPRAGGGARGRGRGAMAGVGGQLSPRVCPVGRFE